MKRLILASAILCIVFVLFLIGCANRNLPINYYLYVSYCDGGIYMISPFQIDDGTGLITPVGTPVTVPNEVYSMAADHTGSRLYVGAMNNGVKGYHINRNTGELIPDPAPTPAGGGSTTIESMALDNSDKYLYATTNLKDRVEIYNRDYNGTMNYFRSWPTPPSYYNGLEKVTVDPLGFFVYTIQSTMKNLIALKISRETGEVMDSWVQDLSTVLDMPSGIAVHPNGKYIYFANNGSTARFIYGFEIWPFDQTINRLGSPQTDLTTYTKLVMAMDPLGRFLYVGDSEGYQLAVFSISSSTGELTNLNLAINGSTVAKPQSIAVTQNGKYLYTTNSADQTITMFKVNDGAAMAPIITTTYPAGKYTISPTATSLKVAVVARVLQW